jgi:hypothetical protein
MLNEKKRQRVLRNKVLKKLFGLLVDEIIESWRKLHNEKLHNYNL